jgi:hypothetical protein
MQCAQIIKGHSMTFGWANAAVDDNR